MIALEQTKNGCGSAHVSEAAPQTGAAVAKSPVGNQGGVEKPGGFTNTNCWTGQGGCCFTRGVFQQTC